MTTHNEVLQLFLDYDQDESGTLDDMEFRNLLRAIGGDFSEQQIDLMLVDAHISNGGSLSYKEFLRWAFEDKGVKILKTVGGSIPAEDHRIWEYLPVMSLNGSENVADRSFQLLNLPEKGKPYSVSVWIKPEAYTGLLLGWGRPEQWFNELCMVDPCVVKHSCCGSDLTLQGHSDDGSKLHFHLSDGQWHNIAVTYDGADRKMYVDFEWAAQDVPSWEGFHKANLRRGFSAPILEDLSRHNTLQSLSDDSGSFSSLGDGFQVIVGHMESTDQGKLPFTGELQELCFWDAALDIDTIRQASAFGRTFTPAKPGPGKTLTGVWQADSGLLESRVGVATFSWGGQGKLLYWDFSWSKANPVTFPESEHLGYLVTVPESEGCALLRTDHDKIVKYTLKDGSLINPLSGVWERRSDSVETWGKNRRESCEILRLLQSGCVRVVRGSYFEDCFSQGKVFEKRQDINESSFWTVAELVHRWLIFGKSFMHIVSYGWLHPDHPDPNMFHLKRIATIVRKLKSCYASFLGLDDIAVAIDFCSLYQPPRTPEQQDIFVEGLRAFNSLYIDEDVTAWKLLSMPREESRMYFHRGWTFAESSLIDAKASGRNKFSFDFNFEPNFQMAEGLAFASKFVGSILPPLLPSEMPGKLEILKASAEAEGSRLFTNGDDCSLVLEIYKSCFETATPQVETLDYSRLNWSADQVAQLCKVLPIYVNLKTLSFSHTPLSDGSIKLICSTLLMLYELKCLKMADCGMSATAGLMLASTVGKWRLGKCSSLAVLEVVDNPFCSDDDVMAKLQKACAGHIRLVYQQVWKV